MKVIKIGNEYGGITVLIGIGSILDYEGVGHVGYYFSQTAPSDTNLFWWETNADGTKKYPFAWIYDTVASVWVSETEMITEYSIGGDKALFFSVVGYLDKVRRITAYTISFLNGMGAANFVLATIRLSDDLNTVLQNTSISNTGGSWQTLSFADYASRSYLVAANCIGLAKILGSGGGELTPAYASMSLKYRIVR